RWARWSERRAWSRRTKSPDIRGPTTRRRPGTRRSPAWRRPALLRSPARDGPEVAFQPKILRPFPSEAGQTLPGLGLSIVPFALQVFLRAAESGQKGRSGER